MTTDDSHVVPQHYMFLTLNPGYVGQYEAALRQLAARGHRITLAYQSDRNKEGVEYAPGERLVRQWPDQVRIVRAPVRESGPWQLLLQHVQSLEDYVRYLRPEFRNAFALRARAAEAVPPWLRVCLDTIGRLGSWVASPLERALRWSAAAAPVSREIAAFLDRERVDVLLVTPLVSFDPGQVEFVRAAQASGRATAHCVASWDNLTNKGSMKVVPDRVLVWNERQKTEAVTLHRVPFGQVVVTGAQPFDSWFTASPSRTREDFLARVGLPPDRPFILYLGSSRFIAPHEATFVERWLRAIRSAPDPVLASAGIMVRPHPHNVTPFLGVDFSHFGPVVMWPPFGADMREAAYRQDFFESMFFCAAAVGVNTSGMIDAGIIGRSVHTVLDPDFRHSQEGTLHFRHLTDAGGGLLHVSRSLGDHVLQLSAAIARGDEPDPKSRQFVSAFVRPLGLDRVASDVLADALDAMGALAPPRRQPSVAQRLVCAALYPVAWTSHAIVTSGVPLWAWPIRLVVAIYVGWLWLTTGMAEKSVAWWAAESARQRVRWRRWSRAARESRIELLRGAQRSARDLERAMTHQVGSLPRRYGFARKASRRQVERALKRVQRAAHQTRKSIRRAAGRLKAAPRRVAQMFAGTSR